MNLKSYLSGLGLGIIVTALILSIAGGKKEMSDDEIMSRAQELGMTDTAEVLTKETDSTSAKVTGTTAAKTASTTSVTSTEKAKTAASVTSTEKAKTATSVTSTEKAKTATSSSSTEKAKTAKTTATSSTEKAKTAKTTVTSSSSTQVASTSSQKKVSTSSKKETEAGTAGKTQTITIVAGDSSYSVAQKLEKAGLVESAAEYDSYLCANGYDRKIRTGTFTVTDGDSKEQIANAITGR